MQIKLSPKLLAALVSEYEKRNPPAPRCRRVVKGKRNERRNNTKEK